MADFFSEIVAELAQAQISCPRLEARELFAFVQHKDASEIYAGCPVSQAEKEQISALVQKRLDHFPLDKIIGLKGFYKNEFLCNEDVLSPRPETEIIVEKALSLLPPQTQTNVLDLGTGSGCIIESILAENQQWRGTAVDASEKALQTARRNAARLQQENRLQFIKASWFDTDFLAHFPQKFEIIVTNPPYIPLADIEQLEPEVKDHDPMLALSGGESGFDSYKRIAELAPQLLQNSGWILIEAGAGQAREIAGIFAEHGLSLHKIVTDLAGIERCVILQKKVAQL